MTRVLVTDGELRASLAVVRSLGRAGMQVFVVSGQRKPIAGASRHNRESFLAPDALQNPEGLWHRLGELVRDLRIDLMVPISEPTILAVLSADDPIDVALPLPPISTFQRVCDKDRILRLAEDLGIKVPTQWRVVSPDSVPWLKETVREDEYPLVLKPHRSVIEEGLSRQKVGVTYASTVDELDQRTRNLPQDAYPLLVQRRIIGPGVGVFLLLWDGEVRASFGHRRIREKPPSGGVSVLRVSELIPEGLYESSVRLLQAVGWSGVAMVEYKTDAETLVPYLMEVNGRFWGSLQLAVDAGVDFPLHLARLALGREIPRTMDYRIGVRTRWLWGDIDHLLAVFGGRGSVPGDRRNPLLATLEFLGSFRPGIKTEVLKLSDPGPFLRETVQWFRRE